MNRKQLTILIVLLVVIGGLGLVVTRQREAAWTSSQASIGQKLLPDLAVNDIAQVTIKQPGAEVNLVKGDVWTVKERHDYPADFADISDFLRKASDLKAVQSVKVGPSQFGRLELLAPDQGTNAGTLVEFKDKSGKPVTSLLLGKKYVRESQNGGQFGGGDWPVGRYLMVGGNEKSVAVVNDPLTDIEAKPQNWLNKGFFKVEKLKSISVTSTNDANSWKLVRETENGELKLADKKEEEPFDASKASSAGFALSSPSFNDVAAPDAKPEETGLAQPLVAQLETFDNFTYTVKVGGQKDEDYHLQVAVEANIAKQRTPGPDEKPEDKERLDKEHQETVQKLEEKLKQEKGYEKWTYLVSKWTIDPLLKERKDFMAEKKDETLPPTPPTPGLNTPDTLEVPPLPPLNQIPGLTPPPEIKPVPLPSTPAAQPEPPQLEVKPQNP
jgi:hypothetical protein